MKILAYFVLPTTLSLWLGTSLADAQDPCRPTIASLNLQAREVGLNVMNSGGNAIDGFLAATLVEYVIAPGVTSIAGPLSILFKNARSDLPIYLDGTTNEPIVDDGGYRSGDPAGKMVLAPGAPMALFELWKRYGSKDWPDLVSPAISIAQEGFELDAMYAAILSANSEKLARSSYGRETFFRNSVPLGHGERLVQPDLANLLRRYASEGAQVFYQGPWVDEFLETVQAQGSQLTRKDFSQFRVFWRKPFGIPFGKSHVYLPSGRSTASAMLALSLLISERVTVSDSTHFTDNADLLLKFLRIQRVSDAQNWVGSIDVLDSRRRLREKLSREEIDGYWKNVDSTSDIQSQPKPGSHSFHITVADCDGNVVTGTNTINSLPWGEGLFVDGVPLSTARNLTYLAAKPGERRLNLMAPWIIQNNESWRAAGGSIGASLREAAWQIIYNIVSYDDTALQAVERPRFGAYPVDWNTFTQDRDANWVDERIASGIRKNIADNGIKLVIDDRGDLGPTALITRSGDNKFEAAWSLSLGSDARVGVGTIK